MDKKSNITREILRRLYNRPCIKAYTREISLSLRELITERSLVNDTKITDLKINYTQYIENECLWMRGEKLAIKRETGTIPKC